MQIIVTYILSICSSFLKIFLNRSENKEITQDKKANIENDAREKQSKIISNAHKTGDLEEIRKSASE